MRLYCPVLTPSICMLYWLYSRHYNHFKSLRICALLQLLSGSKAPAGVLAYGHGLFGDASEVEEGYLATQAVGAALI